MTISKKDQQKIDQINQLNQLLNDYADLQDKINDLASAIVADQPKKHLTVDDIVGQVDTNRMIIDANDISFLQKNFGNDASSFDPNVDTASVIADHLGKKVDDVFWPDQDMPNKNKWAATVRYAVTTMMLDVDANYRQSL